MTIQEARDIILSWCGSVDPLSPSLEEIDDDQYAAQRHGVLSGNENELRILLSLYVSPPKIHDDERISDHFAMFTVDWIETWVLLAPDRTVRVIKKLIREHKSLWVPLLNLAQYLAQTEGRLWVYEIVLCARESGSLTEDIENRALNALTGIRKHENQEWHDDSKTADREIRSGTRNQNE